MNLSAAEKDVKLMDTVSYTNLVPGKEYVLKGKLMDQKTGKELLVNGKPVVSLKKYVPEKKDGTVDVEFVFSGAGLAGTSTVVFEDLYENDVNIAGNPQGNHHCGQGKLPQSDSGKRIHGKGRFDGQGDRKTGDGEWKEGHFREKVYGTQGRRNGGNEFHFRCIFPEGQDHCCV